MCLSLQVDADIALRYQKVMAEWKACEVIVKQREKESHSATLAKFSSGSSIDSHVQRLIHRDSTISNDVGTPFLLTIWSGHLQRCSPGRQRWRLAQLLNPGQRLELWCLHGRVKSRSEFCIVYSCSCLRGSKVHL